MKGGTPKQKTLFDKQTVEAITNRPVIQPGEPEPAERPSRLREWLRLTIDLAKGRRIRITRE